ncbi:hypothetical protein [Petroclostridium sp. X23]|uniref:hypothetical protein n=1 Tax=Petroclostridium sp. X23 TaxID=3045146 RepID=UPI0024ACF578|nr:hypothetical protein [Petroclostridium sp. X23]WHH58964.1 hypothetical protein QKW49_24755 [Petroclostridium sp. X23]
MTIKPIDFQMTIPKTPEISKIQNEDNQRSNLQHHQASLGMQQQAEHDLKKVNSTDKAFEGKIREKQKEQRSGRNKKQSSNNEKNAHADEKNKKGECTDSDKGTRIDIQI